MPIKAFQIVVISIIILIQCFKVVIYLEMVQKWFIRFYINGGRQKIWRESTNRNIIFFQMYNQLDQQRLFIILTVRFMEQKNEDSIQVFIRVRPGHQEEPMVAFTENEIKLDKNQFAFDKIFPPSSTQEDIFNAVGTKLLKNTLQGYNGCIFAYGQTGSGKTYTMIGENKGLMQRSFLELFEKIYALPNVESSISCSYFQIYNEQINDLLDLKKDKKMTIRQDSKKGVFVEGVAEEPVYSPQKLFDCLYTGMKNRHVGETLMNRESSRSHSIFTISLSLKMEVDGKKIMKTPKLHFVDLAGSQRQKMTAASGERLKQAGNINKSLSALGMVINALTSEKQRNHIPYRDSKLTALLRDSLGGNSKTFIVATISCSVLCFQETLSTLNFANRAKMVKVKALINEESLSNNIQSYKEEIRKLKSEIALLKIKKLTPSTQSQENTRSSTAEKNQINTSYDRQFKELNNKISSISDQITKIPLSPTLENLIDQIEKRKEKRFIQADSTNAEMIDETQEKIEEDPLLEYLATNNQLLEKIHTKIDQYIELKGELKNVAEKEDISIPELKTPVKYERQQYQQKIKKREQEIVQLYEQIKKLNEQVTRYGQKIKQLKKQTAASGGIIEQKEITMATIRQSLVSLENQTMMLKKIINQTNSQKEIVQSQYQEVMNLCNKNKQMYLQSEEKFLNEKVAKENLEQKLKEKIEKIYELEQAYKKKLLDQKEQYEKKQEHLTQQIDQLRETIEFNEKLIIQYHAKLNDEEQRNDDLINKIRQTEKILKETHFAIRETQQQLKEVREQYQKFIDQNSSRYEKVKQSLEESTIKYHEICEKYIVLEQKREKQLEEYSLSIRKRQDQITQNVNKIKQIEIKFLDQEKKYIEEKAQISRKHTRELEHIKNKMNEIIAQQKNSINYLHNEIHTQKSKFQEYKNKYENQMEQKEKIMTENKKIKKDLENKISTLKEIQVERTQQMEKMEIEKEEIKKSNEQIVRQNYKLKSKVRKFPPSSNEELINKVNFYEQKFQLMSIQYQQAIETVKKLKERQVSQLKKINFLQENEKNLKIFHQNSEVEKMIKDLRQQNQLLKIEKGCLINENKDKKALAQKVAVQKKQQYLISIENQIKQRIMRSIEKFGGPKDYSQNASLDDLMGAWDKMIDESHKKFDTTLKGIRKEQKMMSHNNMIQKQNILLQGQVRNLTKSLQDVQRIPRKRVKNEYQ